MWMVMSATEITADNHNRKRCFETNVINIATEEEAYKVARIRNRAEWDAGHSNVTWFPATQ